MAQQWVIEIISSKTMQISVDTGSKPNKWDNLYNTRHEASRNSIWNKDETPDNWKESVTLPLYKKNNKNYCSNYLGT
jgi:hypothetical protein